MRWAIQVVPRSRPSPRLIEGNAGRPRQTRTRRQSPPEARPDAFTDEEVLPVFEANLDLPYVPAGAGDAPGMQQAE